MKSQSRIVPVAAMLLTIGASAACVLGARVDGCRVDCEPGMLLHSTEDGRVMAYDVGSRKRLWETRIANLKFSESTLAAPMAWKGLILTGNPGRDSTGLKGRMVALEAKTGTIVWEFLLLPKSEGNIATAGVYHDPFQALTPGMAQLVRLKRAHVDPRAGRQEPAAGCSQGWASLWIPDCLQFPAMPYVGDRSRKL